MSCRCGVVRAQHTIPRSIIGVAGDGVSSEPRPRWRPHRLRARGSKRCSPPFPAQEDTVGPRIAPRPPVTIRWHRGVRAAPMHRGPAVRGTPAHALAIGPLREPPDNVPSPVLGWARKLKGDTGLGRCFLSFLPGPVFFLGEKRSGVFILSAKPHPHFRLFGMEADQ